jgi:hypothetical protein
MWIDQGFPQSSDAHAMDAVAALEELLLLAASSAAINEANLLLDFMIEPRFSNEDFLFFGLVAVWQVTPHYSSSSVVFSGQ